MEHNVRCLRMISLLAFIFLTLFSFFPVLVEKRPHKMLTYLSCALGELAVFLYANRLCKKGGRRFSQVFSGFLAFFILLNAFGIYIGVVASPDGHAINYMFFLTCSQILFCFGPITNLLINLAGALVFCIFTISIKTVEFWPTDVVNVSIAATAGMALNWYISLTLLKELHITRQLEEEKNRFREESTRDELTGLSNRRNFLRSIKFYLHACQNVHQGLCVLMMDVDHFKDYNDYYGHLQGDNVLQAIGKVLGQFRDEKGLFAARVGGEEFILLWTENRISEAEKLALTLKSLIEELKIPHKKSKVSPHITASFGLYLLPAGSTDTTEELYNRADQALYEAKSRGRNCVVLYDSKEQIYKVVTRQRLRSKIKKEP